MDPLAMGRNSLLIIRGRRLGVAAGVALPLIAGAPHGLPLVQTMGVQPAGQTIAAGRAAAQDGPVVRWHAAALAEGAAKADPAPVRYTCPMHPHYISDHAGQCPICGMDLVKMAAVDADAGGGPAAGREVVTIQPETVQNMGVRVAPVERASFGRSVRATANVMENERLRSVVTARVEGWIENLAVTAVGDPVTKGMKLFELYAPELVVSQRDYLIAMRERDRVRAASTEARLRSFGVQPEVMDRLAREGREMERLPFHAERDGVIAELPVVNGEYVKRGSTVLRIQDYRSVWLTAAVPEQDLAFLKTGTPATVRIAGHGGESHQSSVDYIYPTIDPKTRTGRVRLVVPNPEGRIRPGAFADIAFAVDTSARLAVPSEAVLRSEAGASVVVALGQGRFQPRAIDTGIASGRWTEVLKGLEVGEQVVVSGQFLIDSESALREAFGKLKRTQMPLAALALGKGELAMVDHIVDAALYLHEALTDGYPVDPKFLEPAREIGKSLRPRYGETRLWFVLEDSAKAIGAAQAARSAGETKAALAQLVAAIRPWMSEGAPQHYAEKKVELHRDHETGQLWLQRGGRPANPYGRGESEVIAWPSGAAPAKEAGPAPPAKQEPAAAPETGRAPPPTGHSGHGGRG